MKPGERPTGIIRTLPSLYGDASEGAKNYQRSIKLLEAERIPAIYIALSAMPKIEVLYMYLLIEGFVQVRLNIAGYEPGDARECWDKTIRQPKFWVECAAPVSRPLEPVKMRGFQGFRYTEDLW
jgi:hypothetical protein